MISRGASVYPALSALLAVAAFASALSGLDSPLRPAIVLPFLLVGPGLALVRLLGIRDIAAELMLAVALSLALDAVVAGTMVYAGAWSPTAGLGVLVGATLAGNVVEIVRGRLGAPVKALP